MDEEKNCKTCGHWGQEEGAEREANYCECLLSPQVDQLTWDDQTCEFWKGINE